MREADSRELVLWLLGLRRRYRVIGDSMQPTLSAGEEVLIDPRAYRSRTPRRGELVVAHHPQKYDLQIIKRIAAVQTDGRCLLRGDNPDPSRSSDSIVEPDLIRGRVTCRFGSERA